MNVLKRFIPLLICMYLCGCSDINDMTESETDKAVSSEQVTEEGFPEGYPVTVNGIEFKAPPQKAAVLTPAAAEMVFEMGFGENIAVCGGLCDYPDEAAGIAKAGSAVSPDTELILSFSPDIVITESPMSPDDIRKLRDGGAEVIRLSPPSDHTELYNEYLTLAEIFAGSGSEIYADRAMSGYYHETSRGADIGSFLFIMNDNFSVATGDTLAGDLMSCFGENAAEGYTGYRMPESDAAAADPDVIFISAQADADGFISSHSGWKAVENGHIYPIDMYLFERPTSRLCETAAEINKIAEKLSVKESNSAAD